MHRRCSFRWPQDLQPGVAQAVTDVASSGDRGGPCAAAPEAVAQLAALCEAGNYSEINALLKQLHEERLRRTVAVGTDPGTPGHS